MRVLQPFHSTSSSVAAFAPESETEYHLSSRFSELIITGLDLNNIGKRLRIQLYPLSNDQHTSPCSLRRLSVVPEQVWNGFRHNAMHEADGVIHSGIEPCLNRVPSKAGRASLWLDVLDTRQLYGATTLDR